ncbi:MAG: hypothetical protein IJ290_01905 [Bacteroidaceae bacterium]|nr:hypothetical protein [Bacteroidaceae bacterium]MBR4041386.1 hypothetical protein [Bacteroidaceae bacterium]
MRIGILLLSFLCLFIQGAEAKINRKALLQRNSPIVHGFDSLSSLSVGNGGFAVTVDATGLQTFPTHYSKGVPLGTQSDWGWHSFANPKRYTPEDAYRDYDFGRGRMEPYSVQFNEPGRQQDAANWLRINPHRLHLGVVGFELPSTVTFDDFADVTQTLLLGSGIIDSRYTLQGVPVHVQTVCHPERDLLAARVKAGQPMPIRLHFPYPTGEHADDACDWDADSKHHTTLVSRRNNLAVFRRTIDATIYYVVVQWQGDVLIAQPSANCFVLTPSTGDFAFSCEFLPTYTTTFTDYLLPTFGEAATASATAWAKFWNEGGVVDFSACTDPRAPELERRVVLSQYLMAIQAAGDTPPQETGLTYNSWYGKFHLEMIWWHQSHFPLWGHADKLHHTLSWYEKARPMARSIAERQGYKGVRWMKMTDPSAAEAPSKVGSFLIWQQPHLIYLAELVYRANPTKEVLDKYFKLVQETAEFMYSFADYDEQEGRYILKGIIPAQETLRAAETINPPLELSAWHYGLSTAQLWRERMGMRRIPEWDRLLAKLSPLTADEQGRYLAAETATDSYTNTRYLTDHPAVLGALGMYPESHLVDKATMSRTLHALWDLWGWDTSWGWDYPMTAMCAARLGEPQKAVDALLMPETKNTYLPNGHNYQSPRLRLYLPGNGGLLTAVAMMCAGWDGCDTPNPGFPADGTWNVRWEGLQAMP